jgi:predicted kinase
MQPPPVLVVVTGMPGAGKTTLAKSLCDELRLPLIVRDEIKERLYDILGTGDIERSNRLGSASFGLLFDFAAALLESGTDVIIEANFFRGAEPQFSALPTHRAVQIHCTAPLDVLVSRYTGRLRHYGHRDAEKALLLRERFENGVHGPLDLAGQVIEVDTSTGIDMSVIADDVRRLMRSRD